MGRTRLAIMTGAREAVLQHGTRRTSMVEVAALAGVAKATLYNHFRTRGEILAALAEHELGTLLEALQADGGPRAAVRAFGAAVAAHPLVRRLAATEPEVLVHLLQDGGGRATALAAVTAALGDRPDAAAEAELCLRWAASQALWPTDEALSARAVAGLLPEVAEQQARS